MFLRLYVKLILHFVKINLLLRKIFMLSISLLPHKFKKIGWILFIPSTILGVYLIFTNYEGLPLQATVFSLFKGDFWGADKPFSFYQTNITSTLTGVLFIAGALMIAFSKEKYEDEYISKLRLSSLLWAVFVNYSLLLIAFAFIYGTAFLNVMLYNMFTVLIIFIIRFHYLLYRNSKFPPYEKQN